MLSVLLCIALLFKLEVLGVIFAGADLTYKLPKDALRWGASERE